jgi:hypothetical protein
MVDAANITSNLPSLYDTPLPDPVDEALWGLKYLMNCINKEGIQGEAARYRIWSDTGGYRQITERSAFMNVYCTPDPAS